LRESLAERQLTIAELGTPFRHSAGVYLARGGDYAAAIKVLEPLFDLDAPATVRHGGAPFLHSPHALAWAYLRTGAQDKAERLLALEARNCEKDLARAVRVNSRLYECAEIEVLRGNLDQALAGLQRAVDAGWREYYLREREPYWAAVAHEPRYRQLMERVKADVDRQRAEVERIDARENFAAKLDAALAARRAGT
jgi:tetratricopeptide (TPR) repeat protein